MCVPVILAWASAAWANNIAVSNVIVGRQDTAAHTFDIQFDIGWDNSWFIAGAPAVNANWDAAWVFVKYRTYSGGTWGAWAHATLSATDAHHTAPSGAVIKAGCSPSSVCGGGNTGKGVFIYRSAAGTGSVSWTDAQIRWVYGTDGVADTDRVQVKVYALETVYVPTGSFDIGDGSASPAGNFKLASGGAGPVNITSALGAAVNASSSGGNDDDAAVKDPGAGIRIDGDGGLYNAAGASTNVLFPAGYSAFYVMKYDVTQRQYADFLNTLTRTQQGARVASDISADAPDARYVMSAASTVLQRDAIAAPAAGNGTTAAITFGCDLNGNSVLDETADGGWAAAVDLSWMDQAAFTAWAALRPVTELEFEKAARGPTGAAADEYAWGNTTVNNLTGSANDYALGSAGTTGEVVSNSGALKGNAAFYQTTCLNGPNYVCGPVRSGIFAASAGTADRQETGGSYYGVMDLSGGVWKRVVTVGNTTGRAFQATHGSGALSAAGHATNSDWPGYDGSAVTGATGMGLRGGSWISQPASLRVSDRQFGADATTLRTYVYGARAGRTAP
jgi:formylglycine-generating enzyme required for sulfatase activity